MFYNYQDGVLLNGNVVTTPNVELTVETKDDFDYPVEGWHWFDTEEEAREFFGVAAIV